MEATLYSALNGISVPVVPVGPITEDKFAPVVSYRRTNTEITRDLTNGDNLFESVEFDLTLDTYTYAELEDVKAEVIDTLDQLVSDGWRFTMIDNQTNDETFESVLTFLACKG